MDHPAVDQVVELEMGFRPDPGSPRPLVAQSEDRCVLVFHAVAGPGDEVVTGVVEPLRCLATRFGYPNDEALAGHPLWGKGLSFYAIQEVQHSSWRADVEAQNREAFPDYSMPPVRHFVITFHDSTFECLASELVAQVVEGTREKAFATAATSMG